MVLEFVDCNTIKNTIRTFGSYTAKSIWEDHRVPLRDPFDFDIIQNLLGGQPIIETYHRMPSGCDICKKK